MKAFIILPVHNRKVVTLRCLAQVFSQVDPEVCSVVVVDDGSTDGTAIAIATAYPQVTLLSGDGDLWWTGAIRKGMAYAYGQGATHFVWLNDDTTPEAGSIQRLLSACDARPKSILAANIQDPEGNASSYGGVQVNQGRIEAVCGGTTGAFRECDGLNGNLVCLPRSVIEDIGYPDDRQCPQYHGDTVYTHRAKRAGYSLLICNHAIAYCQNDHPPISWFFSEATLGETLRDRFRKKSTHYWRAHLAFYRTFLGIPGIFLYVYEVWIKMAFLMGAKRLIPSFLRQRLRSKQKELPGR